MKRPRKIVIAFLSLVFFVSAFAREGAPHMGLVARDKTGKWVLYADEGLLSNKEKIFVLGPGRTINVGCCVGVVGAATRLSNGENIFFNVETDKEPVLFVYSLEVPEGVISSDSPGVIAIWNVEAVRKRKTDYVLLSKRTYEVDSCLSTEGMNVYLRDEGSNRAIAHYYWNFGYDVESTDCPHEE